MSEYAGRPGLPGYVSIKEAAHMLGISDKRVYEYVDAGRLPSMWAADVIMIPVEAVQQFKRKSSGRPRRSVPAWRISSGDNTQFVTSIMVQVYPDQQKALTQKLEEIRQAGLHIFPGTIARSIAASKTVPGQIEISLTWRSAVMPNEVEREQAMNTFQQTFHGILDWNTAQYHHSQVLMHT
jgi:excisionase family DNA binding protein